MRGRGSIVLIVMSLASAGCALLLDGDSFTEGTKANAPPDGGGLSEAAASPFVDASTTDASIDRPADAADSGGGDGDALSSAVLAEGPIAYFRFEESSGSSSANLAPGGRGTCLVSPTSVWGGAGVLGTRAAKLETTESIITISGAITDLGKSYTIELWIRKTDATQGLLVTHADDPFNIGGQITGKNLMWWNDAKVRTETWNKYQLLSYTLMSGGSPIDTWVHVVYGFDATKAVDFTFVDGVQSTGLTNTSNPRPTVSAAIEIGRWKGIVDEVAIYDKALPQDRAAAHRALVP